jgi:hypothetical protein
MVRVYSLYMADVAYEIQFLDGLGAWRRWAVKRTMPDAEASRERSAWFVGDPTRARVVVRNIPRGAAA